MGELHQSALVAPEKQSVSQKSVLLVGAEPVLIDRLKKTLVPRGWELIEAADNGSALAQAKARSFDVIVTDDETSAAQDIALLRSLRQVHPHVRLIILTSASTPKDVIAA